jgi:hypothetical protein
VLYGAKLSVSSSAGFIKSMTMSDLFNATVTTIAHSRGTEHALPGMSTTNGITDVQGGYFFSSAVVAGSAWGIFGMVGLSIFIIGNIYMALHKRLNAHHNAVVMVHKCYGVLLRIENFLKVAQVYCSNYGFQIDSLEIQEDLSNIYKLLDEITTPDDVFDVYTNLINGRTFRLETVDGNVVPVPEVKPRGFGRMKYFANTFAGIRRLTADINTWTTNFNSVMIELNSHFTLLIGEFFMLSNLHQLKSSQQTNSSFADSLLSSPSVNNPVWCIELQIMLAPILRARVILVSCALSTNTALCRETVNSEMKRVDTQGFSLKGFLKKMGNLYKTGPKQINIGPFIDTLNAAIKDVENSVYYMKLPREYDIVKVYIDRIKDNLKPIHSITQENVANIVDILDEIHNIVLACGRIDPSGYASIKPLHSLQRNIAASILPSKIMHKNILRAYELQSKQFSYALKYDSIDRIKEILMQVCAKANQEPVNYDSYDVAKYYTENESQIAARIQRSYDNVPANIEYMRKLVLIQQQYNRLYTRVLDINPNAVKIGGIVVKRGRDIAACILLLERICVDAITIVPNTINEICRKCNILVEKSFDLSQVNMLSMFDIDTEIDQVIARVLDLSESVIRRDSRGYARLLSPVDEVEEQKENSSGAAAAAAIQQSSISSGSSSNRNQKEVKPPPARPFGNFFTAQGSTSDPRTGFNFKFNGGGKRGVRTCKIKKIKSNKMYKTSRRHRNRSHRKGSRCKHANYTRRQNN